jgi:hypothetical protein
MMGWMSDTLGVVAQGRDLPLPGDYLTDGRELYCVEDVFEDHALIEDCRREALIDIGIGDLLRLEPVKRSRPVRIESRA